MPDNMSLGGGDYPLYRRYVGGGGGFTYKEWLMYGKPAPPSGWLGDDYYTNIEKAEADKAKAQAELAKTPEQLYEDFVSRGGYQPYDIWFKTIYPIQKRIVDATWGVKPSTQATNTQTPASNNDWTMAQDGSKLPTKPLPKGYTWQLVSKDAQGNPLDNPSWQPVADSTNAQSMVGGGVIQTLESEGGIDYIVTRTEDGKLISKEVKGRTPKEATADKVDYNKLMENNRSWSATLTGQAKTAEMDKEKAKREAYEQARGEMLANSQAPVDWIGKWYAENTPNPYNDYNSVARTASRGADAIKNAEEQVQMQSDWYKANGRGSDASDWNIPIQGGDSQTNPITYNPMMEAISNLSEAIKMYSPAINEQQRMVSTGEKLGTFGYKAPQAPQAPSWLPRFAPSQKAGQEITRDIIETPSGQQWAGSNWSTREGLKGYVNWSGQQGWGDIMNQMERALPENPYGVGRQSWRPTAQRR